MKLELTQQENDLIISIKNFVLENTLDVTPRIAGGWVRDKIMEISSSDIDIVLDNMSGLSFAKLYKKHMKDSKNYLSKIGIIKENPEQSKHIETAVVKIFGFFVDFLQLRTEEYVIGGTNHKQSIENTLDSNMSKESLISSSSSRIPLTKPACVIEDALRRDITINTLYYNIMTNEIEDMIGDGFDDIKNQIIRTPLEPYKTFIDDPLRILRVIRFAVRFNFEIQENIIQAFGNENVKEAFVNKISKERVGTEILKIIKCENGMKMLCKYKLYDVVFYKDDKIEHNSIMKYFDVLDKILGNTIENKTENDFKNDKNFDKMKPESSNLFDDIKSTEIKQKIKEIRENKLSKKIKITKFVIKNSEMETEQKKYVFDLELINLYSYLFYFIDKKYSKRTLNTYICKEKLKLSNYYTKKINKIEENIKYIQKIVSVKKKINQDISDNEFIDFKESEIGGILCDNYDNMNHLKIILIKIVCFCQDEYTNTMIILQCNRYEEKRIQKIYNLVKQYEYENVYKVKPILDGHKIKETFCVKGQDIKKLVEKGVILQILYGIRDEEQLINKLYK